MVVFRKRGEIIPMQIRHLVAINAYISRDEKKSFFQGDLELINLRGSESVFGAYSTDHQNANGKTFLSPAPDSIITTVVCCSVLFTAVGLFLSVFSSSCKRGKTLIPVLPWRPVGLGARRWASNWRTEIGLREKEEEKENGGRSAKEKYVV